MRVLTAVRILIHIGRIPYQDCEITHQSAHLTMLALFLLERAASVQWVGVRNKNWLLWFQRAAHSLSTPNGN